MSVKGQAESIIKLRGSLSIPAAIHGKSAYEIAVANGFDGTEAEWLASLADEAAEKSAEQAAVLFAEKTEEIFSEKKESALEEIDGVKKEVISAITARENAAEESANAAKASETNAKTSETNAKNAESGAQTARTGAEASARNATAEANRANTEANRAEAAATNAENNVANAIAEAKASGAFDGKSAYQYAKEGGYTGTEADFIAKLAREIPAKAEDIGAAPTSHTHKKSEITDFPTEMKPTTHTHTKSQITDFPTSMTPTAHNQSASTIKEGGFSGMVWAGASYQDPNDFILRNSMVHPDEITPPNNGEICWMYE